METTTPTSTRAARLLAVGDLDGAEQVCRQILRDGADHADTAQLLGLVHYKRGIRGIRGSRGTREDFERAIEWLGRSVRLNSAPAMWHFNLALALQVAGHLEEAVERYRRVLERSPDFGPAHNNLGIILLRGGQNERAMSSFRRALECDPDNVDAMVNLGSALNELGRAAEAAPFFSRAIEVRPEVAKHHFGLGDSLRLQMRLDDAVIRYRLALDLDPKLTPAHQNLGLIYREQGRTREAEGCFRQAIAIDYMYVPAHRALAVALKEQGDLAGSMSAFEVALKIAPDDLDTIAAQAGVLEMRGEFEEAWRRLEPLIDAGCGNVNVATAFAAVGPRLGRTEQAARLIEQLLTGRVSDAQRVLLHFAAAKLFDALGQFERAFNHADRANRLKPRRFDAGRHAEYVDRLIGTFSPEAMKTLARSGQVSSRPVFIVGMPRSGTTLVEQILSAHADVFGGGELHEFQRVIRTLSQPPGGGRPYPECVASLTAARADELAVQYLSHLELLSGAVHVTDKLPLNGLHLGLINLLLPGCRIVHCRRDARDVCLSCFFQNFSGHHSYAYDLRDLGLFYRQYERLMGHWRKVIDVPILTVVYEELVVDEEAQIRRLIEFCGLSWDDRCLRFYEARRDVSTASYGQVRRPIYRSSSGRWQHYEKHLSILFDALGQ